MSHAEHDARPLVILVVEDDGPVRRAIVTLLREQGWLVFEAVTGEQAVAFLDRVHVIDLIFTDLRLGGELNGWDVGEAFYAACSELPVIYGSGDTIEPPRPVPGSLFLHKPYRFDDLLEACARLCAGRPNRGGAACADRRA